MQHVVAMFGATFLVPLLTDFPPATTLFFSAIGTMLFLLITGNRLPSYLGSSFAFIAPILAATSSNGHAGAIFGILSAGILLAIIGFIVHFAGVRWIELLMPPVVTGTIVALIGFNLAPAAWRTTAYAEDSQGNHILDEAGHVIVNITGGFAKAPLTATVTLAAIILITVLFKGIIGRLSILFGVLVGYVFAIFRGEVDFEAISEAAWIGFPEFTAPTFSPAVLGLFLPVVFVLVAENIGHVKSVAAMTGENLDKVTGRALIADGLATTLAGSAGGSGTTTYAENIGVMAATRVYSTAAYWVAAITALLLSLSPKFGAAISTVPAGVLGGAATLLYGMIGMLGVRIWMQNRVDFSNPINLTSAAVPMIIGMANFTYSNGDITFEGIAIGCAAALVIYHLMSYVSKLRGTSIEPASPASAPAGSELDK
jgi:uracil-xanthine permease